MRIALARFSLPRTGGLSLRRGLKLQRSRRALGLLDADALRDIGINAEDARREASRPIWDAPASWKR